MFSRPDRSEAGCYPVTRQAARAEVRAAARVMAPRAAQERVLAQAVASSGNPKIPSCARHCRGFTPFCVGKHGRTYKKVSYHSVMVNAICRREREILPRSALTDCTERTAFSGFVFSVCSFASAFFSCRGGRIACATGVSALAVAGAHPRTRALAIVPRRQSATIRQSAIVP